MIVYVAFLFSRSPSIMDEPPVSSKPPQPPWRSRPRTRPASGISPSNSPTPTQDHSPESRSPITNGRMYTLSYTHAPAKNTKKDPTQMWDKVYSHSNSPNRSRSPSNEEKQQQSSQTSRESSPFGIQESRPVPAKRIFSASKSYVPMDDLNVSKNHPHGNTNGGDNGNAEPTEIATWNNNVSTH